MPVVLEHEGALGPVTALSSFQCGKTTLILAGEGSFLRVYQHLSRHLLWQTRVFASQTVNGITITTSTSTSPDSYAAVLIWGGSTIRVYDIRATEGKPPKINLKASTPEIRSLDWVLDCSWVPSTLGECRLLKKPQQALLITAHNALLCLELLPEPAATSAGSSFVRYNLEELSSSSRSVLYSAHVFQHSPHRVFIAAGTVFGQVLLWSCDLKKSASQKSYQVTRSRLHYVFTGHEGSIFGVHVSHEILSPDSSRGHYFLASCSDDRTIRIWDITDGLETDLISSRNSSGDTSAHCTGFESTGFEPDHGVNCQSLEKPGECVAIIWAHTSRIWGAQMLRPPRDEVASSDTVTLISWGEDATCQLWEICVNKNERNNLIRTQCTQKATTRFHSGKNIWSLALMPDPSHDRVIVTGGADGRITTFSLAKQKYAGAPTRCIRSEWKMKDILGLLAETCNGDTTFVNVQGGPTRSCSNVMYDGDSVTIIPFQSRPGLQLQHLIESQADTGDFKGYAFLDEQKFIFSTGRGALIVGTFASRASNHKEPFPSYGPAQGSGEICWELTASLEDLHHYSLVASVPQVGVAFVTGANGIIYCYQSKSRTTCHLTKIEKKISGLFTQHLSADRFLLFVTCVRSPTAYLYIMAYEGPHVRIEDQYRVDLALSFVVTSFLYLQRTRIIVIGARSGTLAFYDLPSLHHGHGGAVQAVARSRRVHGEDAVTVILELSKPPVESLSSKHYLLTAGRDGMYSIHLLVADRFTSGAAKDILLHTVHTSTPPFGPNIEGAYLNHSKEELILYGFRGKNFVVWNESTFSEILNVECGGGHRSWAYSPFAGNSGGGSFVWTKASSLNLRSIPSDSQLVLQYGGHGREIKALAITAAQVQWLNSEARLLATGAEDTSIRIFEYNHGCFRCIGVLKKHTTGIQHLRWSDCGHFLFSCGGSEEFYVWRLRPVPVLGVGIIQEAVCAPQSPLPDVRIMSFEISQMVQLKSADAASTHQFLISMVYSDSSFRIYRYTSSNDLGRYQLLHQGLYASSCLTQVHHVSLDSIFHLLTAGTDGFISYWSLDEQDLAGLACPDEGLSPSRSPHGEPSTLGTWQKRFRIHQSTVKSMAVAELSHDSLLVLTGGDDNAVAITWLCLGAQGQGQGQGQESVGSQSTIRIVDAHASAVTAITTLSPVRLDTCADSIYSRLRFATASNDQRIKIWEVTLNHDKIGIEALAVKREATVDTCVADVAAIGVLHHLQGSSRLMVCGVGMEAFRVVDV